MASHFRVYHWEIWDDNHPVLLQMIPHLKNFKYDGKDIVPEPVLVPPTWNKTEYHRNLSDVWSRAAAELGKAENIFIIGYSLPETDTFFKYLYALGSVGANPLKRIWVFNPDSTGLVQKRFHDLLGPAAAARFKYFEKTFQEALPQITQAFNK